MHRAIYGWSYQAEAQENEPQVVRSGPLVLDIDPTTGAVRQLEDAANDLSWHADGAEVWKVDEAGQRLVA